MFGNVLTYDVYHLALYLFLVLAWGALGLHFLQRGIGIEELVKCCAMFGLALAVSSVMLVLDILRVLEHHQVEIALWGLGGVLPASVFLISKTSSSYR